MTNPVLPHITLPRMLDEAVARFPQSLALSYAGSSLTFSQLRRAVDQLAMAFTRLDVRPGDRVAFVGPNCPQLVIGTYAAMRIGAVAVLLDPAFDARVLHEQLVDCDAEVVLCVGACWDAVNEARRDTRVRVVVASRPADALGPGTRLRLRLRLARPRSRAKELLAGPRSAPPGSITLSQLLLTAGLIPPSVETSPASTAVVLYEPHGDGPVRPVVLSHRSLVAAAYQTGWWLRGARAGHETTLGLLPLSTMAGLTLALNTTLLLGGRLVLVDSAAEAVAAMRDAAVTYLPIHSDDLRSLLDAGAFMGVGHRVVRDVLIATAGFEPPTVADGRRGSLALSAVSFAYGVPNAAGLSHATPFARGIAGAGDAATIGIPLPLTESKVVDLTAARRPVSSGEVGELLIRGPQLINLSLDADGFYATGVLATTAADASVSYVGQVDDAIRVGRQWVWPTVVEAPVSALPQVARAAAVQGYGRRGAGIVKLYVEPAAGAPLDSGMIRAVCETELPANCVPGEIEIRASLPLTEGGQVARRELRDPRPARSTTAARTEMDMS